MIIQSKEQKEKKKMKKLTEATRPLAYLKISEYTVNSGLRGSREKVAESTASINSKRATPRHIMVNMSKPKRK